MNTPTTAHAAPLFCITGELASTPTVRMRSINGHPMPVLQLVLQNVGPYAKHVTCEQVFPHNNIAAAHARAHQLKKGDVVDVQAPLEMLELHMHAVEHIRTNKTPEHTSTEKRLAHAA